MAKTLVTLDEIITCFDDRPIIESPEIDAIRRFVSAVLRMPKPVESLDTFEQGWDAAIKSVEFMLSMAERCGVPKG